MEGGGGNFFVASEKRAMANNELQLNATHSHSNIHR